MNMHWTGYRRNRAHKSERTKCMTRTIDGPKIGKGTTKSRIYNFFCLRVDVIFGEWKPVDGLESILGQESGTIKDDVERQRGRGARTKCA